MYNVYRTYETQENYCITDIIKIPDLDKERLFSCRLRIEKFNFDIDKMILGISLRGANLLMGYILVGDAEIKSFLEDMQVLEEGDSAIPIKLKGRTLDGIFYKENGKFYALCPTARKGELLQQESERLKHKIERRKNEYKILKINKKLIDDDYTIADELEKLGLLNKGTNDLSDLGYDAIDEDE